MTKRKSNFSLTARLLNEVAEVDDESAKNKPKDYVYSAVNLVNGKEIVFYAPNSLHKTIKKMKAKAGNVIKIIKENNNWIVIFKNKKFVWKNPDDELMVCKVIHVKM